MREVVTDEELKKMGLPQLEALHSEMLATCSDIGLEPGAAFLVTIETVAQGASVCKGLHEQIVLFRKQAASEKKDVADVPAPGDTESTKKKKVKTREKSVTEKMAEQKAARLARDATVAAKGPVESAGTTKETTVASKAKKKVAKKKVAKKVAKKSGAKRSKFDPASKIHWIRTKEGNGAREGTPRHERREALRKANGQTVKTYLEKGGKPATLARAVKDKDARVEAPAAK